jgi:hypothetical protein
VDPFLFVKSVQGSVPRYGAKPCEELALGVVVIVDLPESLLEAPGADVIDVIVVDILETGLDIRPKLVNVPVP